MNDPTGDELLQRLRSFQSDYFPRHQQRFQDLVSEGQHPKTLFIGCSDSRLVPYLLTGAGPGDLFMVRNVGALVPPYDGSQGLHGTMAAVEFGVLSLFCALQAATLLRVAVPAARCRPGPAHGGRRAVGGGAAGLGIAIGELVWTNTRRRPARITPPPSPKA